MLVAIALCNFEGYKIESTNALKAEDTSQQGTQKAKEEIEILQVKEQFSNINENDQEEKKVIEQDLQAQKDDHFVTKDSQEAEQNDQEDDKNINKVDQKQQNKSPQSSEPSDQIQNAQHPSASSHNNTEQEAQQKLQSTSPAIIENNSTQSQTSVNSIPYLTFKKDDRIVVKYQNENGWWWGCLLNTSSPIDGYFPSTYVKSSHQIRDDNLANSKNEEEIEKMDWKQYAEYVKDKAKSEDISEQYDKFITDTAEGKNRNLEIFLNPGIKGYKKVKIDPAMQDSYKNIQGSFFSKEGDTVFIPIKSQDPLDRACRQLNHYFDYDRWNEQMNMRKPQKKPQNKYIHQKK